MENRTEAVFILDCSGSMAGLESDTVGGFNAMIERQQAEPEGNMIVSTILFSDKSSVLHDRVSLGEIEPLSKKDYRVGGRTALLDTVGNAINHIKNIHTRAREEDRPQKTLFIIATDGMENASRKFRYKEIKQLIKQQKGLGWEFIFLGANLDAEEFADHIGIDASRAVNYHSDELGTKQIYVAMSKFISCTRRGTLTGEATDDAWRKELDEDFKNRKK
ncbi:MAG: VWA domain-containing protein [Selenomonadaceae bacterium]|nr:VWA domain-containing protein [Selenomonadaceae bacterium]